jgi:hypothetical protein
MIEIEGDRADSNVSAIFIKMYGVFDSTDTAPTEYNFSPSMIKSGISNFVLLPFHLSFLYGCRSHRLCMMLVNERIAALSWFSVNWNFRRESLASNKG